MRAEAGRKELLGWHGRSGMEGVGRYGRYGWNGRNGWNSVQRYNFSLILPNLGGVIRKCLNSAFRLKVVKLPYS